MANIVCSTSSLRGVCVCVCVCVCVLDAQSCLTLCDPMDCSPPGFSVHGILQARILECIAIPLCRGTSLTCPSIKCHYVKLNQRGSKKPKPLICTVCFLGYLHLKTSYQAIPTDARNHCQ